nr:hypothetical protein [Tanacetum cinerariifolium]
MKIDLDDKTDVLGYHKKLLAEALKEKEDLKSKFENWQNSSKNLNRLLNIQMSANDKFGLGYEDYRYGTILSYENEVLQSVFMNKECDLEDTPINDRYGEEMHAVPLPMTGNYMPSGPDVEIDYSKFTYGLKQTSAGESDSKPVEYASSDSVSSVEITTSMPAPVDNAPKIVCCNWRSKRNTRNKVFNYNDGSKFYESVKDPLDAYYQEFKGGFVAFGGSNERITGKGKIKSGMLDFEDIYYADELKHYNLFSVSQCVTRRTSFNLKNIDPSGDLACLFAKALIDESNKWHRRLGHVNFKNLNKLMMGNLVRGLPSKIFENDHTCVACQKGKQHKASWIKKEYNNAKTL